MVSIVNAVFCSTLHVQEMTLEESQLEMWVTPNVSRELGIQGKQDRRENSDRVPSIHWYR